MPALPVPPMLKLFSAGVAFGGFWTPPEDYTASNLTPGLRVGLVLPDSELELELVISFAEGTTRSVPFEQKVSFNHLDLLTNVADGYRADFLLGGGIGWRHTNIRDTRVDGKTPFEALGFTVNPVLDLLLSAGPSVRYHVWGPIHVRVDAHGTLVVAVEPRDEGARVLPGADASLSLDLRYELPPDRDHDGVQDTKDKCPASLEDWDFFDDNDGCLDPDDDKDGIVDLEDRCKGQAEDVDGFQDADGCDDHNNDRDAYPDAGDGCPNEPESENAWQDGDGCPDAMPADLQATLARGREITFLDGEVNPASEPALLEVVARLAQYPEVVVLVAIYTDSEAGATAARERTLRQAKALRRWFAAHDAPARRVDFRWKGDTLLLNNDKTEAEHLANRRVELTLVDTVGSDGKTIEFSPMSEEQWR